MVKVNELIRINDIKEYHICIDKHDIDNNLFLRRLKNVEGSISFYYDLEDKLRINYELKGNMICPCALSLEDVEVPFDLNNDEEVVFNENDEGFYLRDVMEIEDLVTYIVLPEMPIKVVKKEKIEYSRGDGWSLISEEDYEKSMKDEIDPRLKKLKDFKFEEED